MPSTPPSIQSPDDKAVSFTKNFNNYGIHYPKQVNQALSLIKPSAMLDNLSVLTKFPDRGANHTSGVQAANWIHAKVQTMAKKYHRNDVKVYFIETQYKDPMTGEERTLKQPSIIAKIGNSSKPGVVIGAHFDTVSCTEEGCIKDPYGPLPGANDDGSGTVTVIETMRTLLASGMQFKNPLYFIWYAAEEWGLIGSQSVVTAFINQSISISAVFHLDQTGYAYQNETTMWLENSRYVDSNLTHYLKTLITTYIKKPVNYSNCHGCSDHESWSFRGFKVVRPVETDYCSHYYPYHHSNEDTIDKLSLNHMTDYLELAVSFVIELAEPVLKNTLEYKQKSLIKIIPEIKHDTSKPLRDISDQSKPTLTNQQSTTPLQPPFTPITTEPVKKDFVAKTSLLAPLPVDLGVEFTGIGVGLGKYSPSGAPPDTNGAAGLSQYMQWANLALAVFNKADGNLIYGPVTLEKSLWKGFAPCDGSIPNYAPLGDTIIKYDQLADRWVITNPVMVQHYQPKMISWYYQCIAISTSGDATGSYHRYVYQFENFPDYGKLSMWPDAYYMTMSMYSYIGPPYYKGTKICAFNRKTMLLGQSTDTQCKQLTSDDGHPLPADLDGKTLPSSFTPAYFLGFNPHNKMQLWKFKIDWNNPHDSIFIGPIELKEVAPFVRACPTSLEMLTPCIPQPNTSITLNVLSDRLMYRLAYRQFSHYGSLVATHSISTANSISAMRWYQINIANSIASIPHVIQQGTYLPDTNNRWMGSIAMDKNGNIALGYSTSNKEDLFPSIAITGRGSHDPLNILRDEKILVRGHGAQLFSRWGDYTSMTIDPEDDCTFWYTNEYLQATSNFNWSTRIFSFSFPDCTCPLNNNNSTNEVTIYSAPTSSQKTEHADYNFPYDDGKWDENPQTHPETNEPIFIYRVYRDGIEIGSATFYKHPLLCRSETGDRHNLIATSGVLSSININAQSLHEVCEALPPTFWENVITSATQGAKHGAIRGVSQAIGYTLQARQVPKHIADRVQHFIYYGGYFLLSYHQHLAKIADNSWQSMLTATYQAVLDTGSILFINTFLNRFCKVTQQWGERATKRGYMKLGRTCSFFGNVSGYGRYAYSISRQGIEGAASILSGSVTQYAIERAGQAIANKFFKPAKASPKLSVSVSSSLSNTPLINEYPHTLTRLRQ